MYALEPEPEQKNRGRRMIVGGLVAAGFIGGFVFVAQNVEPVRRLLPDVVRLAVVDEPPPKTDEPPPLPPPPPPPPKAAPPKREPKAVQEEQQPKTEQTRDAEPQVGLDASSFGQGEGGFAFHQGNTQMGDPNRPVEVAAKGEPKAAEAKPVFHPPRAVNPTKPKYPERARRKNIEGFVLIEANINERGELKDARVRKGCDPLLDKAALETVRQWRFEPASMAGRKVASTHLIRIRFSLV